MSTCRATAAGVFVFLSMGSHVSSSPELRQASEPGKSGFASVASHRAGDGEASVETCVLCHPMPADLSHPVGVVPSMRLPDDFPIDGSGRMTCVTCHDLSGSSPAAFALRRPLTQGTICVECHQTASLAGRQQHASVVQALHAGRAPSRTHGASQPLDDSSAICLGCHDGSIAGEAEAELSDVEPTGGGPRIGKSHPVGVDYSEAIRHGSALATSGPLHAAVRLYEGTVGCASCHSPFSSQAKLLVLSNDGSALCLQCHRH